MLYQSIALEELYKMGFQCYVIGAVLGCQIEKKVTPAGGALYSRLSFFGI